MTVDRERQALSSIVNAAGGRASSEATIALAIDLMSPWASTRHGCRDRVDRGAGSVEALISFVREVRPKLGPPLPTDHGPICWASWNRVLLPLASLPAAPNWLIRDDDALVGGYVAPPPLDGHPPSVGVEMLRVDGRLLALHLLLADSSTDREPVKILVEFFCGPRLADVSGHGDQCAAMAFPNKASRAWNRAAWNVDVDGVTDLLMTAELIPDDWKVPPAELAKVAAAEAERAQIQAAAAEAERAWRSRKKVSA